MQPIFSGTALDSELFEGMSYLRVQFSRHLLQSQVC